MRYLSVVILLVLSCSLQVHAQDIHFSQFNRSYLNLNPALTGVFDGNYRFNGNFKNQWSSVSEPYRTISASVDTRSPILKLPNLHLGLSFFNDEAGVGGLENTQVNLNMAYGFALNLDSSLIVTTGMQFGYATRSINFNQFNFDQQYNGRRFDQAIATGEDFYRNSSSSFGVNMGFGISYTYDAGKVFSAGIALFNLTSPDQGFNGVNVPLDQRTTTYLKADYQINRQMDIIPSLLYSKQGRFNEFLIGSDLRYHLENKNLFANNLYGGIWYRNKDAIILSTGLDYLQWHLGFSYDINISELETASNNRGGLEISITYIFKNFNPVIRRYKVCPSFM